MTISLPEEDRSYLSKHYMEDQLVGLLGGRVAESLCLGDISTGASNDIQRATAIARKMVAVYGMSETLGRSPLTAATTRCSSAVPWVTAVAIPKQWRRRSIRRSSP